MGAVSSSHSLSLERTSAQASARRRPSDTLSLRAHGRPAAQRALPFPAHPKGLCPGPQWAPHHPAPGPGPHSGQEPALPSRGPRNGRSPGGSLPGPDDDRLPLSRPSPPPLALCVVPWTPLLLVPCPLPPFPLPYPIPTRSPYCPLGMFWSSFQVQLTPRPLQEAWLPSPALPPPTHVFHCEMCRRCGDRPSRAPHPRDQTRSAACALTVC